MTLRGELRRRFQRRWSNYHLSLLVQLMKLSEPDATGTITLEAYTAA